MGSCKIGPKPNKDIMFQSRDGKVSRVKRVNVTLEETLRPLWKLTYYSGVLLEWCVERFQKHPFVRLIQYLSVCSSFCLLVSVAVFEVMQLLIEIKGSSNIHSIITNLMWLSPFILVIVNQVNCLYDRKNFISFFKDWSRLEKEFTNSYAGCLMCNSKKIHLAMYVCYALMSVASIVSLGIEIFQKPEASYLLSYYPGVRETIPLSVVCAYHLTSILLAWVLMSLGDVIPSFVYYYLALAVESLEKDAKTAFAQSFPTQELKQISLLYPKTDERTVTYPPNLLFDPLWDLDVPIRHIWSRFEKLNKMIGRANKIFGTLVVGGQGGGIFLLTILLYSVLYNLRNALNMQASDQFMAHLMNFVALSFRFISCVLLSSNLHRSVTKLRTTLNNYLGINWDHINPNDRISLRFFITRLQSDDLIASPHGLYSITQSSLLTVLSLVVSYVIVLLQSK